MSWNIPYFELRLGDEEKRAAMEVLEANWLTTGPKIGAFETAFSEALGGDGLRSIAVSNCTVALHLALAALGIGPGDEVICPSLTFVATANAVRYTGATPVFADVVSETDWTIDPAAIAALITPRTKAILVVHYAGYPCDMGSIMELARQHDLKVVEDNSHGPLAEWRGQQLGTIGDVGCFSFFSNKNMTTGEGGMVVTRNPQLADQLRIMRSHGMTTSSYERFKGHAFGYDVVALGYNFRMDEIRAAIGLEQLKKLPGANARRKELVQHYHALLAERLPQLTIPFKGWEGVFGYHIIPVLLPPDLDRAAVMAALGEQGIQTSIHYRPIHTFSDFAGTDAQVPVIDAIAPRILSLPLYPTLQEDQVETVVEALKTCLVSNN